MTLVQSYPPASELRRVSTIKLDVKDIGNDQLVDEHAVRARLQSALSGTGVQIVADSEPCSALAVCRISYFVASAIANVGPLSYAYCITLNLLTSVSGQPAENLYCIWNDTSFGTMQPARLSRHAAESAEGLFRNMLGRIKEATSQS